MAKTYIPGETKEQRKARKRGEKSKAVSSPAPAVVVHKPVVNKPVVKPAVRQPGRIIKHQSPQTVSNENFVLCLKHGSKYSAEYVNTLNRMVKKWLRLDYTFCCLTENPQGIDKDVKIIPLPDNLIGWWNKPYMYSNDLPIKGNILYMDLDVVISGPLDKLFEYAPNDWCVIRDFTRAMQPSWEKYNSSVVRFKTGQLEHVWKDFIKDPKIVMGSHFGDQDWLWTKAKGTAKLWPDSWIRSWKWEIRKDRHLRAGNKGDRKFVNQDDNAVPSQECSICVFHGDPNPHNCDDRWVVNNWR